MTELSQDVLAAIDRIRDRIDSVVDKDFVDLVKPIINRLECKAKNGEKLNLKDLYDVLKIYRNIVIPSAMRNQVNILDRGVRDKLGIS